MYAVTTILSGISSFKQAALYDTMVQTPGASTKETKKKAAPRARAVSPWRNSKAKRLLYHDILDGVVTASMEPATVFRMRPEYQVYHEDNFKTNLKNLKQAIKDKQEYAVIDSAAFAHDSRVNPPVEQTAKGCPRWNGSAAEALLKQDMDDGLHLTMKPAVLRMTRSEYQAYPLAVFRPHIGQEKRSRLNNAYWLAKKKKKKNKPLF
jgi:hypothetical protein